MNDSSTNPVLSGKKRYAVVGTGSRVVMFLDAIAGPYAGNCELVGMCDICPSRMQWHNQRLREKFGTGPVPMFDADAFERMIEQTHPQTIIVTTIDSTHHEYIVRAMRMGCDVICEKPLAIHVEGLQAIEQAIRRTGCLLRVAFNYRYAPHVTRVRELIQQGAIGRPLAVDLHWVLDTSHGADYFRRWHAEMDKSGGLLVHKSTHHFDLVNWWIGSYPQTVFAMGDLKFYGPTGRKMCKPQEAFRFRWEDHPDQQQLYGGQAIEQSGYRRDRDVFGDHVTIYDTMSVTARYQNGVLFNYSLLAYSPWEGFRAAVTGTDGRIELFSRHGSHILTANGDAELARQQSLGEQTELILYPQFCEPREIDIPTSQGAHGGGDPILLEQLFSSNPPADPFDRAATYKDGAASVLLGIAANESIRTGQAIKIDSLLNNQK